MGVSETVCDALAEDFVYIALGAIRRNSKTHEGRSYPSPLVGTLVTEPFKFRGSFVLPAAFPAYAIP